jgi:hypothetical protein
MRGALFRRCERTDLGMEGGHPCSFRFSGITESKITSAQRGVCHAMFWYFARVYSFPSLVGAEMLSHMRNGKVEFRVVFWGSCIHNEDIYSLCL